MTPPAKAVANVAKTISKAFRKSGEGAAYLETLKVGSRVFRIEIENNTYAHREAKISLWANNSWQEVHTLFPPFGPTPFPPGMKSKLTRNGDYPFDMNLLNEDREELLRVAIEIVFRG